MTVDVGAVVAEATVRIPATCGELLQGVDADGPLLVSLPVDIWGSVHVALTREPGITLTPDMPKARAALHLALQRAQWRGGAVVELGGEIAHSRGMGSSTADVAGVISAVCRAAGVAVSVPELVALMAQVEPSDSSPLDGLWAIDHVRGCRVEHLAPVPTGWWVVAVDSGVAVRTLDVHQQRGAGPRIPDGIVQNTRWRDPIAVARVATESARRNQERLPHVAFDTVHRITERIGAPGICVAHSGSLCAVICAGLVQAVDAQEALAAEGLASTAMRTVSAGQTRASVRLPQREAS
jgi:L-threonine kinase